MEEFAAAWGVEPPPREYDHEDIATTPREKLNAAESRCYLLIAMGQETAWWNLPKHAFLAFLFWRAVRHLKQGQAWLLDETGNLSHGQP